MEDVLLMFLAGVIVVGALGCFVVGCCALRRARRSTDEQASTLYLLALNLCEPLINIAVITTFASNVDSLLLGLPFEHYLYALIYSPLQSILLTSPMAVLLLPAMGLFFRERRYRRLSGWLFGLGSLRWALNILIFVIAVGDNSRRVFGVEPLAMGLIGAGTGILWLSGIWGKHLLDHSLRAPATDAQRRDGLPQPG